MKFLIIADSHGKNMASYLSKLPYTVIIKSIPGLKFVDNYQKNLSLLHMLFSHELQTALEDTDSVLFLIGTNSIRCFTSFEIINQIQEIVFFLKHSYVQLNRSGSITICATMPCLKSTRKFRTEKQLMNNIECYNEQLNRLSYEKNFKVLNLPIDVYQLSCDKIHVHFRYQYRIFNCIIDHFNLMNDRISSRKTEDKENSHKYYKINRRV
ncbi:unnamed protein product [Adineta ricciae]|uniref:SGNH hydrolase-type esterase domain-containing protein n=1 Tax=Adineta ricciae TaxID=249248 RepID=A0A815KZ21_ADIRI|nr:unnamed protein product [Adineta ricciae]CAF1402255.1 unnamed protein product [Adineta ricciae]